MIMNGILTNTTTNFALARDDNELKLLDSNFLQITDYVQHACLLLSVFGIVLNSYVLCRLILQAYNNVNRFVEGSGLPLLAMAIADLLSISLLLVSLLLLVGYLEFSQLLREGYCKTSVLLIHTMTGTSMWCWMLASGLRYMAVYHPFSHMRRWRLGSRAIFGIVIVSLMFNAWLLIAVKANEFGCQEKPFIFDNNIINRCLHAVEIGWSYLAPALVTGLMDARVFLKQPPSLRNIPLKKSSSQRSIFEDNEHRGSSLSLMPVAKPIARAAVGHWLLITSVDLLLNAPDNAIRLLVIAGLLCEDIDCAIRWNPFESHVMLTVVIIARLLYFAQFTFNAIFLTAVIYRRRNMEVGKTPMPTPYRPRSRSTASQSTPYRPRTRSAASQSTAYRPRTRSTASQSTPYRPRTQSAASQYRPQHHSRADMPMARLSPSPLSRNYFIGGSLQTVS